jgi:di/tricarboxylate transporter
LEPFQASSHPITETSLYLMIIDWFVSQMPMFAISIRLPIIAIAYPVMVDIAVDLKLASSS